jgi:competence protein ComEC
MIALLWALLLLTSLPSMAGTLRVEVLDVGQGDGILVTSPGGKRVLIDASIRSADVVGMLAARGVTALDLVVATHPHADHIGGLQDVIENLPVKLYTDSGQAHTTQTYIDLMTAIEARGIAYRSAVRGQSYSLDDGIRIEVLGPPESPLSGTRSDLNSNSVVLRLTHGKTCFLFTGDAEEPTEAALLRGGLQECAVLKVAHHGSNHSTTDSFLRAVKPQVALISCGLANRYKHPGDQTLARLASAEVEVYRTDLMGTLVVESDGEGFEVRAEGKAEGAAAVAALPGTLLPTQRPAVERAPPVAAMEPEAAPKEAVVAPMEPVVSQPEAGEPSTKKKKKKKGKAAAVAPTAPTPPPPTISPGLPAPAAAPAAPSIPVPGEAGCLFVSARSSPLYHPGACHIVERIWEGNRICWASEAEAMAAGKRRSASCPEMTSPATQP